MPLTRPAATPRKDETSVRIVVGEQQSAEPRSRSFVIGPADHSEFLAAPTSRMALSTFFSASRIATSYVIGAAAGFLFVERLVGFWT